MHYRRNIIKGLRKPSFYLYYNSVEKLYQPYPKEFLTLWNKGQKKKYNQGQLFHTNFLCYLLFLFLNTTRISVVEHNQIYQPKSFHSGTFRQNLLYVTKYD